MMKTMRPCASGERTTKGTSHSAPLSPTNRSRYMPGIQSAVSMSTDGCHCAYGVEVAAMKPSPVWL